MERNPSVSSRSSQPSGRPEAHPGKPSGWSTTPATALLIVLSLTPCIRKPPFWKAGTSRKQPSWASRWGKASWSCFGVEPRSSQPVTSDHRFRTADQTRERAEEAALGPGHPDHFAKLGPNLETGALRGLECFRPNSCQAEPLQAENNFSRGRSAEKASLVAVHDRLP